MPPHLKGTARRIADDDIYLNEDRREEPKVIFVEIGKILDQFGALRDKSCIDVGCATGDLLHYLKSKFPDLRLHGMDISPRLLEVAGRRLPDVQFSQSDISSSSFEKPGTFDFCIMSGVLNCFDDAEPVLDNLIAMVKPGGRIVVLDMINEHPVDVVVRHRRSSDKGAGEWEVGWNYVSKATLSRLLRNRSPDIADFTFTQFRMPFPLKQRDDPMRTWTIPTESNPHQIVNGAKQMIELYFLVIDRGPR